MRRRRIFYLVLAMVFLTLGLLGALFLGARLAEAAQPATSTPASECGLNLWAGGERFWVPVPCAAITTATPSHTPTPTFTAIPSATPEWNTPTPGTIYPVLQPCRLASISGNVNLRASPWGAVLQVLPYGEVINAVAMTWAASDGTMWLRANRNGQWVYFARWVMAVRTLVVDGVVVRDCLDPFVLAVTP